MLGGKKGLSDMKLIFVVFALIFTIFCTFTLAAFLYIKSKGITPPKTTWFQDILASIQESIDIESGTPPAPDPADSTDSTVSETTPETDVDEDTAATSTSQVQTQSNISVTLNGTQVYPKKEPLICQKFKILAPPQLASEKCYTKEDYALISEYYMEYEYAEKRAGSYQKAIDLSCGKDAFKVSCDYFKEYHAEAENDIKKYQELILELIKKGF